MTWMFKVEPEKKILKGNYQRPSISFDVPIRLRVGNVIDLGFVKEYVQIIGGDMITTKRISSLPHVPRMGRGREKGFVEYHHYESFVKDNRLTLQEFATEYLLVPIESVKELEAQISEAKLEVAAR